MLYNAANPSLSCLSSDSILYLNPMTTAQATPTDLVAERIIARIAPVVRAKQHQVAAAIGLFDAGNTMPFIARYRKEVTGGLDEAQLAAISEQLAAWRALEQRRATGLPQNHSPAQPAPRPPRP